MGTQKWGTHLWAYEESGAFLNPLRKKQKGT